jgi:hypothetical protein
MVPLMLYVCALAGAVLLQAFIRMLRAPSRTMVAATTRAAGEHSAGLIDGTGRWENEGGSLASGLPGVAPAVVRRRPNPKAPDSGAAEKRKAA